MTFPENAQMHLSLPRPSLALSPDGRRIVYTANGGPEPPQLWIRDLDQFAARPIPGTRNARMAAFSSDGRWIAFFADGQLKKVPTTPYPEALPDGRRVLVTMEHEGARTSSDLTVALVDLESGHVTRLLDGAVAARYAATGHLIYLRNGVPGDDSHVRLGLVAASTDGSHPLIDERRHYERPRLAGRPPRRRAPARALRRGLDDRPCPERVHEADHRQRESAADEPHLVARQPTRLCLARG